MRIAHGLIATAFVFGGGCVRLGYEAHAIPAPHGDGGAAELPDAAVGDAGASGFDASSSGFDAGASGFDAGASGFDASSSGFDAGEPAVPLGDASMAKPDAAAPASPDAGEGVGSAGDGAMDDGGNEVVPIRDAGPSPLCPERPGAALCEDFEDLALDRWQYVIETNGTVQQTTTFSHAGAGSLHVTTGVASTTNEARLGTRAFDHVKAGDLWLRYYYYIPSSTSVTTGLSTGVIAEVEPPYFGFSLMIRSNRVEIGSGSTFYAGTAPFPRDQWTCVELHVLIDAVQGVFEAYLDGTLAAASGELNTVPAMGYSSVDVGIHYTAPYQGPVEAYVDDVVAATTRLGCL